MLVFVLNQAQKANTGKIQTPVYENVREFGLLVFRATREFFLTVMPNNGVRSGKCSSKTRPNFLCFVNLLISVSNLAFNAVSEI